MTPHDVRQRRQLRVQPAVAMRVGRGEHPVADGERGVFVSQLAGDPRQRTRAVLAPSVVHPQRLAMHLDEPHQREGTVLGDGLKRQLLGHRRREAHAAQAFEIDVDHGVCIRRFKGIAAARTRSEAPRGDARRGRSDGMAAPQAGAVNTEGGRGGSTRKPTGESSRTLPSGDRRRSRQCNGLGLGHGTLLVVG
jgi:hypothetical protein